MHGSPAERIDTRVPASRAPANSSQSSSRESGEHREPKRRGITMRKF